MSAKTNTDEAQHFAAKKNQPRRGILYFEIVKRDNETRAFIVRNYIAVTCNMFASAELSEY